MKAEEVFFGCPVRLTAKAFMFKGARATIAYIGNDGVSVYLLDSDFDDCIPLRWNEFELDPEPRK